MSVSYLEVAVFAPLRQSFHYLPPPEVAAADVVPGTLVKIPFGRSARHGVVLAHGESDPDRALKAISAIVDAPAVASRDLELIRWAARYYQHPVGEVFATALPNLLRRGRVPAPDVANQWQLVANYDRETAVVRGPRQREIVALLENGPLEEAGFRRLEFDWRRPLKALTDHGLVRCEPISQPGFEQSRECKRPLVELNSEQSQALDSIIERGDRYTGFLVHGVTGSGKTELYIAAISELTADGGQALVLVPEIALTKHLVARFERVFGNVAILHSGLSERERALTWLACQRGERSVVLGTRSAVWTPLPNLKCIVVDEEHDPSYKQHDGFRYNARDVAIVRARENKIPAILGSATPSFEALRNAMLGKFVHLRIQRRAGGAQMPHSRCIDIRGLPLRGGLSDEFVRAIDERLERGEQTLLFLNRRGYAPTVLCHQCGAIIECERCDAKLVFHRERNRLVCHHCDKQLRFEHLRGCCENPEFITLGQGTEQLEETVATLFPNARIARVDRDSVRRKNRLEEIFEEVNQGRVDILLGTQMLAKGHDFANITLVGIVDADSRLFSLDFRAEERLAQLLVQVAGRAGRSERPGEVLIQTHQPFHPLFTTIVEHGYEVFAQSALGEREAAELPPFRKVAVVRAESSAREAPARFLRTLAQQLNRSSSRSVEISGPVAHAMERRAGMVRLQLLLSAERHSDLADAVSRVVDYAESSPAKTRIRWSVDIDPQDI